MEPPKFEFQKFLEFFPDKGLINFSGSRRLLFNADSLGELRRELVSSLGDNIARGILTRFGFQWGKKDAEALGPMFRDKAEWLLGGPMMHSWQGVVHVENNILKFKPSGELELMKGTWRHSYEAEQHLRLYGPSIDVVCWSLVGYATGYASKVFGEDLLCLETACVGSGHSECIYEIRPIKDWGSRAKDSLAHLKPVLVVKSLGRMLQDEKVRAAKRRLLVQAVMEISGQKEMNTLVREIVSYAKGLTDSECASLSVFNQDQSLLLQEIAGDKFLAKQTLEWNNLMENSADTGKVIREEDICLFGGIPEFVMNVLGIPLFVQGTVRGSIFVINKRNGEKFTLDDEESLQIIANRVGIVFENHSLYRRINHELEITVRKLETANEMLNIQYRNLEDSIHLQQQLVNMVLEGRGLKNIVQTIGVLVGGSALVMNDQNKVVAQYGETAELKSFAFSSQGPGLSLSGEKFRIVEQGDISTGIILREIGNSATRMVVLPVSAGARDLGMLIVGESQRQFTEVDLVTIRQTATVIALEMLKGIEVELKHRTNYFDQLLSGRHDNPQNLQEQGSKVGFNLADEHWLVLVEVDNTEQESKKIGKRESAVLTLEDFLHLVTKAAEESAPGSAVFTKDGFVTLLVRVRRTKLGYSPNISEVANYIMNNLKRVTRRQAWITVGSLCRNHGDYLKSYGEARSALEIVKKLKLPQEVLFYDQLGIYSLMFGHQKLEDFINGVLGKLLEYDRKKKADLVATLKFYIKNNYNLQQAAKVGFVSPSTLKYRLKKIQEVGNLDLNDPDTRLQVELALKVIKGV